MFWKVFWDSLFWEESDKKMVYPCLFVCDNDYSFWLDVEEEGNMSNWVTFNNNWLVDVPFSFAEQDIYMNFSAHAFDYVNSLLQDAKFS